MMHALLSPAFGSGVPPVPFPRPLLGGGTGGFHFCMSLAPPFFVSAASKTAPRTFGQTGFCRRQLQHAARLPQSGSRQSPPEPPTPRTAERFPSTEPARGLDGLRAAAIMAQRVKLGRQPQAVLSSSSPTSHHPLCRQLSPEIQPPAPAAADVQAHLLAHHQPPEARFS